jgi:galactokinase
MYSGRHFQQHFGHSPTVVAVSPGRINLIGEHIDYLGGCVMPVAIDRHLTVEAAKTTDGTFEFLPIRAGFGSPVVLKREDLVRRSLPEESWQNYLIGVIAGYRAAGVDVPGFRAVIHSDLPTGAGLSSSAALETAVALVIEALTGVEQDVVDRALLCQRAEHDYAGVPCGIMDQLAVGAGKAGHVLHLDCRDLSMQHFPLPSDLAILTADTRVKHALGDGEYRKRREDCDAACAILGTDSLRDFPLEEIERFRETLGDQLFRRVRHAISEMARVTEFSEALVQNDSATLGRTMRESHESLRDDYEVSCPELDHLVEAAYAFGPERGLAGSRMTGGGFGGSTVSLVRADAADALKAHLEGSYRAEFGRELNCFITSAVDGANSITIE